MPNELRLVGQRVTVFAAGLEDEEKILVKMKSKEELGGMSKEQLLDFVSTCFKATEKGQQKRFARISYPQCVLAFTLSI